MQPKQIQGAAASVPCNMCYMTSTHNLIHKDNVGASAKQSWLLHAFSEPVNKNNVSHQF